MTSTEKRARVVVREGPPRCRSTVHCGRLSRYPPGVVRKSGELSVEMWFRTSTGGPLFGVQNQPDSVTPTSSVPLLYVGTDGKFRGQFWTGTVTLLASAGTVTDDQWHHVVLSSTINSQTLYLDGQVVSTRSGAINHGAFNHSQVGAAFAVTPSQYLGWGTVQRRSFTGVIDEVAVYQHPLGLPAVQAHHRARADAAQMSKLCCPAEKQPRRHERPRSHQSAGPRQPRHLPAGGRGWRHPLPGEKAHTGARTGGCGRHAVRRLWTVAARCGHAVHQHPVGVPRSGGSAMTE